MQACGALRARILSFRRRSGWERLKPQKVSAAAESDPHCAVWKALSEPQYVVKELWLCVRVVPSAMAAQASPPASADSHEGDDGDVEEEVPLVDVLDPLAVKRGIDDCIVKVVSLAGYPEDLFVSNTKLALMTVACAVALYGQLGPHSFPENKPILIACASFYAAACVALQIISTFVEQDYIMRTYAKDRVASSSLRLATRMARGSHLITVAVEFRDPVLAHTETLENSVGTYFSDKGEIDELQVQRDVQALLAKMEAHHAQQRKAQIAKKDT